MEGRGVLWAFRSNYGNNRRNNFASFFDNYGISNANIFAFYFLLVMKSGPGNRCARYEDRFEFGDRSEDTGSANLNRNVFEKCFPFARGRYLKAAAQRGAREVKPTVSRSLKFSNLMTAPSVPWPRSWRLLSSSRIAVKISSKV